MKLEDYLYKEGAGRDFIFTSILNRLPKPCNILELGCARSFEGHAGDGWSSVFWADFIQKNGGSLDIVDIDNSNLECCRSLLSKFNFTGDINLYTNYDSLKETYDFIYIDVSDDPTLTLELYKQYLGKAKFIAVDDYHTKGVYLHQQYPAELIWRLNNGHLVAGYGFIQD